MRYNKTDNRVFFTCRKGFALTLICLLLTLTSLSAAEEQGTTGFNFLRVTYSARAAGMANAYTGLSDDANAVFFNPAGLFQLRERSLATGYVSYLEGFHGGSIVYAFPVQDVMTMALFSQYLGTTDIVRTEVDDQGNYLGPAGTFGANNLVFGISGSRFIHEMLNIGATAKVIREQLDDNSAVAIAADIALLHQTTNDKLIVGVVLKNFGKQLTYHTSTKYEEKLPTGLVVGFRYFPHHLLNTVLDIAKPFEGDFRVNVGLEYSVHPMLDLRTGYNARANDWRAGGDYDFMSGVSFGLGVTRNKYKIDYAVSSYGDLGFINQINLKYAF